MRLRCVFGAYSTTRRLVSDQAVGGDEELGLDGCLQLVRPVWGGVGFHLASVSDQSPGFEILRLCTQGFGTQDWTVFCCRWVEQELLRLYKVSIGQTVCCSDCGAFSIWLFAVALPQ